MGSARTLSAAATMAMTSVTGATDADPQSGRPPEAERAAGGRGGGGEGRRAEVGVIEQQHGRQAAGGGAEEIGGVEAADRRVRTGQRQGRDDSAQRERRR